MSVLKCPHCDKEIVVYPGYEVVKPHPLLEIPAYKPPEPTVTDKIVEALEPYLPQIIEKLKKSIGVDNDGSE